MENARVLARILGPVLIISAAGILLNPGTSLQMIGEYGKSDALCYLGGFMALLLGLITLQFHNKWESHWPVVITITGWWAVVKGAALIVFPKAIMSWYEHAVTPKTLIVGLSILLVVGVYLTIKGYSRWCN